MSINLQSKNRALVEPRGFLGDAMRPRGGVRPTPRRNPTLERGKTMGGGIHAGARLYSLARGLHTVTFSRLVPRQPP